jgi:hypothetical protein
VAKGVLEFLAFSRGEWSQIGVMSVGNPEEVVEAVRHLHLEGMDSLALIGWIVAQSAGGGIRPVFRTTWAKLRRLSREGGVAFSLSSARQLGHAEPTTTLAIYSHFFKKATMRGALDGLLRQRTGRKLKASPGERSGPFVTAGFSVDCETG